MLSVRAINVTEKRNVVQSMQISGIQQKKLPINFLGKEVNLPLVLRIVKKLVLPKVRSPGLLKVKSPKQEEKSLLLQKERSPVLLQVKNPLEILILREEKDLIVGQVVVLLHLKEKDLQVEKSP